MPPSLDADELAAVVVDGRPFEWADVGDEPALRPMQALWHAVRHLEGVGPATLATPARLSAPFVWLTLAALLKAVVTAGLVTMAVHAVDLVQVVTLASLTVVGVVLLYGGHRDLRARRLGVVLVLLGSVMTKPLLRQVSEAWAGPPLLFTLLQGPVLESMLPLALWRFVEVFPQAMWSPRDTSLLRYGLASSTLLGWLLLVGNALLGAGVRSVPGLSMLNRDTTGVTYFWPLFVLAAAPALGLMLRRRRDAADDERRKVTAFMTALVLALLPAALIILLYLTPIRLVMLSHDALTGAIMYSGLVAMPLATGYAVVAHRVLRVDMVVRNAARYTLARGLLLTVTAGPLALLVIHAYQNRHLPVAALFADGTGRTLLAMSGIGALLIVMRERIQQLVDRALRRDSLSLASALDVFARRSGEGLGLGDVAEAMQQSIMAAFHPNVVALLVADRARDAFVPVGAAIAPLPRASWLARSLTGVRDPVVVDLDDSDGVARLLPPSDQDWLADGGVVVLTPLMAGGSTLCGLVAIGPMASGRPYADGDLQFLGALAAAAAPAIESRLLRQGSPSPGALDDVHWDDESGRECPACGRAYAADVNTCPDCERPTASMSIPVRLHGKFTVLRRLGAGGMGVAYLATDDALARRVALKSLPRVRPESVEQLRREARAMAQVSHPALAAIHGLESWRAVPVLVVEYLPGGTLADRLRGGPLPEADVIAIARHVLGGLRRLHESGRLHRDLKPSNIGFAADGTAKVLDFGLSRLRGIAPEPGGPLGSSSEGDSAMETSPDASSLAGTPAYMSPELVSGRQASAADDVWALAVVMLESLQGRHPWANLKTEEVLRRLQSGEGPGWSERQRRCSDPLAALIARALSNDEADRPSTAAALELELARLPQ